jgi:uncharacterized C2H2 Zn-finger protein
MPWFPDFISAAELARRQTRAAGQADPVAQYITALNKGDIHTMQTVWPGEMVVYDPRIGEIRGHKQLRRFVSQNHSWLAGRHARIETVASTSAGGQWPGRSRSSPNPRTTGRWCSAPTAASGRLTDGVTSGLRYSRLGPPALVMWSAATRPR